MKTSTIFLAIAIPVVGIIGYYIGRNSAAAATPAIAANVSSEEPGPPEDNSETNIDSLETADSTLATTAEQNTPSTSEPASPSTAAPATPPVAPLPTADPTGGSIVLEPVKTGISDDKISRVLESISDNMEKQKLAYVSSLGQDCSGIFHRIKDSIQVRLPALRDGYGYKYPKYSKDRSSRQIADWYYRNGNLMIIEDAVAARNSIRPGSVMFFGKPNKKFRNMTIEKLTDRDNNYTSNGIIMHVAVVTSVRTDEEGNVVDYTMMHGRNSRIHASRTGSKEVQSKRTKGLPPFGNWSQQWVAVANIATPESNAVASAGGK